MTTNGYPLEGERAKLVLLREEHAEALLEAARDTPIWGVALRGIETLADAEAYIRQALAAEAEGDCVPFAIVDKSRDAIVGSTRFFDMSEAHRSMEIGNTWLNRGVWRTRMNTECKFLLLRDAFERREAVRVQLKCDLRNTRSQAAIERLGAVKEGVLRKHRILADGYVRDTVMYSITDEEWPAVKAKLASSLDGRP